MLGKSPPPPTEVAADRIPELLGEIERLLAVLWGATDARRYYDVDEWDRAAVYFGEPVFSGYVLIRRDDLPEGRKSDLGDTRRLGSGSR